MDTPRIGPHLRLCLPTRSNPLCRGSLPGAYQVHLQGLLEGSRACADYSAGTCHIAELRRCLKTCRGRIRRTTRALVDPRIDPPLPTSRVETQHEMRGLMNESHRRTSMHRPADGRVERYGRQDAARINAKKSIIQTLTWHVGHESRIPSLAAAVPRVQSSHVDVEAS